MEIHILGTSSMRPTKERGHSANLFIHNGKHILIDCGENTQRQLRIANIPVTKVSTILITHFHGDHVLGLPGLLQSMRVDMYHGTLHIYGPRGSKNFIRNIFHAFVMKGDAFGIEVHEIAKDGLIYKDDELSIFSKRVFHTAPCLAYSIIENDRRRIDVKKAKALNIPQGPLLGKLQKGSSIKLEGKTIKPDAVSYVVKGRKFTILTDLSYDKTLKSFAKDSDVLICEATYLKDLEHLAKERHHLTAEQAAKIAKESKAKKLVLTHFSQRYRTADGHLKEAKKIFHNVETANDFTKVEM